jgi:hypothetical protein
MVNFALSSLIRTEWASGTRYTGQEKYCVCQESNIGHQLLRYLLHSWGIRVPVLTFYKIVRTKAPTEVTIKIVILLNVTSCNLLFVYTHQPFGEFWYGCWCWCWMKFLRKKKWRIFARLNGVCTLNQKIRRQEI